MSAVKRYKLFASLRPEAIAFLPDEVVSGRDYDALAAECASLTQAIAAERAAWNLANEERNHLKAEVARLRGDAERYQWLRGQAELESYGDSYCLPEVHAWYYKPGPELNEQFADLDAAIDAAMTQEPRHD